MTLSVLFWVLYIVSIVFGLWSGYTPGQPYGVRNWGGPILFYVLIGILGWAVFGAAIRN